MTRLELAAMAVCKTDFELNRAKIARDQPRDGMGYYDIAAIELAYIEAMAASWRANIELHRVADGVSSQ